MRELISLFFGSNPSDELVLAQVRAFQRRVPILYAVLAINTVAVAVTHFGKTPDLLALYIPVLFVGLIAVRLRHWFRLRHAALTTELARTVLRRTTTLAVALAVAMLSWGVALYLTNDGSSSGRVTAHGHVVMYIGLTVICCATLLMHVRRAATLISVAVIPPFCLFLVFQGSLVEIAVAVNLALVAASMLYVLIVFSQDFRTMVLSKLELSHLHGQQKELANTDALTGLANRRRFFAELERAAETGQSHALIVFDLDGFKQINDVHGHVVGDEVLVEIGRRITDGVPQGTIVARLGGDEFGVILSCTHTAAESLALSQTLIAACSAPIRHSFWTLSVGASAGVNIVSGPGGEDPIKNYERADYALFHVKQTGKGRVELFSPTHEQRIRAESELEQALKRADFDAELSLLYQPIVRAQDFKVIAFEALARWNNPELGEVSPCDFIPLAEGRGLINAITKTVVAKALRDAERLPHDVGIRMNLSARDIASPQQTLLLLSMVRESGVDPRRLAFEITESSFINDMDLVQTALTLIKASGIAVAIDDFGTGYSSLSYIHRIAPDELKIDRSFTSALSTGGSAKSIVKSIIELSRNIGARCLAEGTENAEQVAILRELGCDEFQGYYFGKPQPIEAALAMTSPETSLAMRAG